MKQKIIAPYAPILVESTRSVGYTFEAALADIIDNSISNSAKEVHVNFQSIPHLYLAVCDDGSGMSGDELDSAMRYGSKSSLDQRDENDLGRFGLGMKMASLSQCRRLTVITKTNESIHAARWDMDHIIKTENWSLLTFSKAEIMKLPHVNWLMERDCGTIVIWEDFDRLSDGSANVQKVFDEKLEYAREHMCLIFHRFIGDEQPGKRIKMFFNGNALDPMDPFLVGNPATQALVEHTIRIDGQKIKVKPYILPYYSKLSSKDKRLLGDINDLRHKQGFYIYRNRRLILWGTWFRMFKQSELNKLARIRVDIPNSLDSIWEIDIKKSTAALPEMIRKQLVSIVEDTIGKSERVYRFRGRKVSNDAVIHTWNIVDNRGTYHYQINRELPMLKAIENMLSEDGQQYLESLLHTLEETFPYGDVYYRMAKNEGSVQNSSQSNDEVYRVATDIIASIKAVNGDVDTFVKSMGIVDYFQPYPEVVSKIREELSNE